MPRDQRKQGLKVIKETPAVWRRAKGPSWLTKYERSKIIGIRARQLMEGAEPLIKVPPYIKNPLKIAELELEQNKLPFLIKRVRGETEEHALKLEEFTQQRLRVWEADI